MTTKLDTQVKWFHSQMPDAPALNGVAGSLVGLLNACLLNGFSSRSPDSVVVMDGVATVGISAGSPYEKHAVIAISGASDPDLNGEWRIAEAAAASFTFACPGVGNGIVTGATVKRAPAGWGSPFSGTNKGVYQSQDPVSTQLFLRVDDSLGRYANLRGYEDMTDVDSGEGLFPTTTQLADGVTWAKSSEANVTAKNWALFADGSIFYIYQATYGTSNPTLGCFGDIVSFVPGDRYHCTIAGSATSSNIFYPGLNAALLVQAASIGTYMARRGDQIQRSQLIMRAGIQNAVPGSTPTGSEAVAAPLGGEVLLRAPLFATDTSAPQSAIRGIYPGLIEPLHRAFTNIVTLPFEGSDAFAGRLLAGYSVGNANSYGSFAIDLTGPWR